MELIGTKIIQIVMNPIPNKEGEVLAPTLIGLDDQGSLWWWNWVDKCWEALEDFGD